MNEILGHEVEEWRPASPEVGPPLPRWLGIYWPWYVPPVAEFRVNNLVISPKEVELGQAVIISCTVKNIGNEAGSYTLILGGDFTAEQTVTLGPGESRAVSFEVIPAAAKTHSVSVNGLTGSFKATEVPVLQPSPYLKELQRSLADLIYNIEMWGERDEWFYVPGYGLTGSVSWGTANFIKQLMIEEAINIGLISSAGECYFVRAVMYFSDGTIIVPV